MNYDTCDKQLIDKDLLLNDCLQFIKDVVDEVLFPLAHTDSKIGVIAAGFGSESVRLLSNPPRLRDNMFWDDNNPEDLFATDPDELASYIAENMNSGETWECNIRCARNLPDRKMKINLVITDDDEQKLHWEWIG